MNIEELRDYCISLEGVEEKTPFGKFAHKFDTILVFYVLDHIFCMTDMIDFSAVTMKLPPEEINNLKATRSSAVDPFNLSHKHWVEIRLNGDIADHEIQMLIVRSYNLVKEIYTKKKKKKK